MSDTTWHPQQIVALGLAVVMVTTSCTSGPGGGRGGVASESASASASAPASAAASGPASPAAPPDAAAIAAVRDASQRIVAATPKSIFDPDQQAAELGRRQHALHVRSRQHPFSDLHRRLARRPRYAHLTRGQRLG